MAGTFLSSDTGTRSAAVTSYDIIKAIAILTMIIDHIGFYFFPDDMSWRAVGRMSAPFWLFLVGYARSRDLSPKLWIGLGLLIVSSFIFGGAVFPINILLTIVLIRLTIDYVGPYVMSEQQRMLAVVTIIFFAALPTIVFSDYGSIGYMTALMGYVARQRYEGKIWQDELMLALTAFSFYVGMCYVIFGFSDTQLAFVLAGCAVCYYALYHFRPAVYPAYSDKFFSPVLKLLGSRTLEIYVVHILIFRALAAYYEIGQYGFFEWAWL